MAVNLTMTDGAQTSFLITEAGDTSLMLQSPASLSFFVDSSQTGPQGPPGADANLPAGTINQILRHDGSDWITTSQLTVGDNVEIQADAGGGSTALRVHGAVENKDAQLNRVIGAPMGGSGSKFGNTIIGESIGVNISSQANYNTIIGSNVAHGSVETMLQSTLIGSSLIRSAKNGSYNIIIGDNMIINGSSTNNIMGIISIGARNLYFYTGTSSNSDRQANVAIGSDNFQSLSYGISNTAIGDNNMAKASSCDTCVAIGRSTMFLFSGKINNSITIGRWAGLYYSNSSSTINDMILIGTETARSANLGDYSICIGYKAGRQNTAGTGRQICIGYQAGRSTTKNGTFIGENAGNGNAHQNVLVIGTSAQADADNQIAIGSRNYTDAALFLNASGKDGYSMRYNERAGKVELTQDRITVNATLDFPSTAASTSSELTVKVTGAVVGDAVSIGAGASASASGGSFFAWVSAADTVTIRFCNHTSSAIDPPSDTFKIVVLK